MLDGKRIYIFLAIYFLVLMIPAYWVPLFETTDARYAEISREMLVSGNWLEPFYNGIKHFHKPPFTYWINALGMGIFGINGFGARFFGGLAAVFILLVTRRLALLLSGNEKTADNAFLILASSVLFLVVSNVVSTDIYLVLFTVLAQLYMFNQVYAQRSTKNAFLAGVFLGLGFLTKGPIIFLFTLLPFVTAMLFDRKHRAAFSFSQWGVMLIVFAVISLPWYAYVVSVNDGLLNYFLKDQTVERVATDKFNRSKPFYFFFMVFFGTFIPWAFYFLRNFVQSDFLKPGKLLYLYVIMPFIVFQISTSKLGTYILPFYPVAAIIAAVNVESAFLRKLSGVILLILGCAICAVPFAVDYARPYMIYLLPLGVVYTVAVVFAIKRYYSERVFLRSFTVLIMAFVFAAYAVLPFFGPYIKGYKLLADDIKAYDPAGQYPVIVYRVFAPSVSFYLNKVVPIAFSKERETQFQSEADVRPYLIETTDQLKQHVSGMDDVLILHKKTSYEEFEKLTGFKCEIISNRGGTKYVRHCRPAENN